MEGELPGRRIVLNARREGDRRPPPRGEVEREPVERDLQAEPAGLDVGLLERPIVEEGVRARGGGQLRERFDLGRREVTLPLVVGRAPAVDPLDVDADVALRRHRARHQAPRVGQVEAQRGGGRRERDLRTTVSCGAEAPLPGRDRRIPRERRAEEGVGHQEAMAVLRELELRVAGALRLAEQRKVRRLASRPARLVGERVPDVHVIGSERPRSVAHARCE